MQKKTDEQIKHEVMRELAWDTRTWNLKIEADVTNGVVTFNGIVPSYAQKIAAQNAAHRLSGVLDVINELIVKASHKYSDAEIARAVRQALVWDVLVPDEQIQTTVSDGWVKLEGKVNSIQQREDAERAVLNLSGVVGVINVLQIESPKIKPENLRKSIEEALERRADREAERFRINVKDGEVDLYGRVHSWRERRAVVGSISHAPGVKKINDNLRIDPYF